jgi:hypothetical protein
MSHNSILLVGRALLAEQSARFASGSTNRVVLLHPSLEMISEVLLAKLLMLSI